MAEQWRVACVRIPRFPIAAVWRTRNAHTLQPHPLPSSPPTPTPPPRENPQRPNPQRPGAPRKAPPYPRLHAVSAAPPSWDDALVALVSDGRLRAVSGAAARAGVRSGMTALEARARSAALEILDWDDTAIASAIAELSAHFLVASPQVTPAAHEPGLWWIGAHGLEAMGGERMLVRALAELAGAWHPRARVAVASSCVAARAATWAAPGKRTSVDAAFIVPAGGDAAYLAPAPLALIPMDGELRATLAALGIGTAGAFAALDSEDVERRWGAEGLEAWRLARGEDVRRPVLATVAARHAVEVELSSPATTMEPVLFLLRPAIDRLASALASEGRAAATIAITLTLDDRRSALPSGAKAHTVTRQVHLPRPVARAAPLVEQCRSLLDTWTLTAPVCGLAVAITSTAPATSEQGDLLALGWHDPAAADAAFARLRAELGARSVVRPALRDEHRPERNGAWCESDGARIVKTNARTPARAASTEKRGDRAVAIEKATEPPHAPALRLLETPEAIEVEWDGDRPCALWWRERRVAIGRASGPERLSGDWWKDGYARDYWRCESDSGELLAFRERDRWFVQGWYD
jgi:protein ImuB